MAVGPVRDAVLRRFEYEAMVDWDSWDVHKVGGAGDRGRTNDQLRAQECGWTGDGSPAPHNHPRVGMWVGGRRPAGRGRTIGTDVQVPPPVVYNGAQLVGGSSQSP